MRWKSEIIAATQPARPVASSQTVELRRTSISVKDRGGRRVCPESNGGDTLVVKTCTISDVPASLHF
jgi:hypothetical protein